MIDARVTAPLGDYGTVAVSAQNLRRAPMIAPFVATVMFVATWRVCRGFLYMINFQVSYEAISSRLCRDLCTPQVLFEHLTHLVNFNYSVTLQSHLI